MEESPVLERNKPVLSIEVWVHDNGERYPLYQLADDRRDANLDELLVQVARNILATHED